jgi:hypothetical protein
MVHKTEQTQALTHISVLGRAGTKNAVNTPLREAAGREASGNITRKTSFFLNHFGLRGSPAGSLSGAKMGEPPSAIKRITILLI